MEAYLLVAVINPLGGSVTTIAFTREEAIREIRNLLDNGVVYNLQVWHAVHDNEETTLSEVSSLFPIIDTNQDRKEIES